MRFEREQCLDLDAAFARTWLLADGRGASAAGCVLGCPVSRHHGLLIAPAGPDGAPHVFLERLEEWLVDGERALPVSSARYPGVIEPSGHTYLASFDVWPVPTWRYLVGDVEVVRTLAMLEGPGHGVEVRWRVTAPRRRGRLLKLRIRPFVACRPASDLTYENPHADKRAWRLDDGVRARPYATLPDLTLRFGPSDGWTEDVRWYHRYEHVQDAWNGREAREDHLGLGLLEMDVGPWRRGPLTLRARVEAQAEDALRFPTRTPPRAPTLRSVLREAARRHACARLRPELQVQTLLPWADLEAAPDWASIALLWPLLGEPFERWADAWALPGNLRTYAGPEAWARQARALYVAWASAVLRLGRPTRRGAGGAFAPERMARELVEHLVCGESEHGERAFPLLLRDDSVEEERYPADLNARWLALAHALGKVGPPASRRRWRARLAAMRRAFRARLWLEDEGHLADAWVDGVADRSVRPGMLVAAAEPAVPLSKAERLAIVERARIELLTPRGLRTLSPRDPAYDPNPGPRAPQPPTRRNGAVEPRWLLPYAQATLLARGRTPTVKARLRALVEAFTPHLSEHGLGCVAEVFDGEPPHRASGAPSDVRSILALLEVQRLAGAGGRRGGRA